MARQRNTEGRLLYAVDEPLPWWMAFFPAPQHVFTMFSGVVIVPMPQAWATYVRTNITMKRWGCVSSVVFLICGVSIAAVGEPLPQQFKVGVILPFSGELASLGQEAKRGMQLALDDLGGAKTPLKLIFADDHRAGTPATVPAAQKLLNVDRVDLGLTLWIEDSRLIAPLFTARKIPLVVLWDSNESIHASGDFVFSNGFSTEAAGTDMASFATQQLKVKNVAVLRHEDAWAEIISQSFMRQFEALGGKVVYAHAVPLDLQDFRPLIAKMRDAGAGAFYFPMLPPPLLSFIWQVRELQVEAHLMTGDAFIQDVVRQGGRASEGIYMTNIHYPDTAQLLVSYQRKFGAEPVDFPVVACGYDGMKRVIEAVKLVQKSMSMQRALADVLGPERTAQRREAIFQVNNGQRILVYAPAQGKN